MKVGSQGDGGSYGSLRRKTTSVWARESWDGGIYLSMNNGVLAKGNDLSWRRDHEGGRHWAGGLPFHPKMGQRAVAVDVSMSIAGAVRGVDAVQHGCVSNGHEPASA